MVSPIEQRSLRAGCERIARMDLRTDIVLVDERLSIRRTILAARAVFAA
jgi:hypothetical protein